MVFRFGFQILSRFEFQMLFKLIFKWFSDLIFKWFSDLTFKWFSDLTFKCFSKCEHLCKYQFETLLQTPNSNTFVTNTNLKHHCKHGNLPLLVIIAYFRCIPCGAVADLHTKVSGAPLPRPFQQDQILSF